MSEIAKVTRFEVIDDTGRILTRLGVSVQLSYQDDDRTLKVFLKDTGTEKEVLAEMTRGWEVPDA